ncbi:hypothetical protein KRP22_004451 [Phytophthora ramorum]|nr:Craniofacial development protein 1 [Phytophthora ramorum]
MGSSSDEDDGDYVPEAEEEEEDDVEADAVTADKPSVTQSSHVDNLWEDMNASTAVSKTATDKTAKLLGGLTKKTKKTTVDKKKKRKLKEFQMPILSVDVNKSRKDMAGVKKHKVDRVVKFAGKEYSVSTNAGAEAAGAQGGKKGLDKMLASLDEPKKVSTMEKSSLDWDKFKEKEGIEDELTQYTKDGFIEKQEFLQRLDLKRFEIEKAERDKQRKLQQQQK